METQHPEQSRLLCANGNNKGYKAIYQEAQRLGWPRLWSEDLTVLNRERLLSEKAPIEFAWAVRETGTFLMERGNADDLEMAKSLLFCREKYGYWPDQRYYWFDGNTLSALTLETIIERLNRYTA
jgi:hypothetical protein